jgi:hypothetical protein
MGYVCCVSHLSHSGLVCGFIQSTILVCPTCAYLAFSLPSLFESITHSVGLTRELNRL